MQDIRCSTLVYRLAVTYGLSSYLHLYLHFTAQFFDKHTKTLRWSLLYLYFLRLHKNRITKIGISPPTNIINPSGLPVRAYLIKIPCSVMIYLLTGTHPVTATQCHTHSMNGWISLKLYRAFLWPPTFPRGEKRVVNTLLCGATAIHGPTNEWQQPSKPQYLCDMLSLCLWGLPSA